LVLIEQLSAILRKEDSIGDIEYEQGNIRIGLRANGIPANLFIELI
jgi:hypothetical protein